jgi:phosphotriesterase-related protein
MKKIMTVCGEIAPEELGFTTMHEHTLMDAKKLIKVISSGTPVTSQKESGVTMREILKYMKKMNSMPAAKKSDYDFYETELEEFKMTGGRSLLDCTPIGGRVDMRKIRHLSEQSGVKIVTCTGLYIAPGIPKKLMKMPEDGLITIFSKEIEDGIGKTGVKPGYVKSAIATLENGKICELELRSLRAAGKTAKKYGMSVHVHTSYPLSHDQIVWASEYLSEQSALEPERILLYHIDSSSIRLLNGNLEINEKGYNPNLALGLLKAGFNIGLDSWGTTIRSPEVTEVQDESRLQLLKELIDSGYGSQIVLGHDVINRMAGKQMGRFGYTRFPVFVRSRLKDEGYDDEVFHKLAVTNPARILAY